MLFSEIIPGVYSIRGRFAPEFGFISSYLVVDGQEALIIDPGTYAEPGEDILKAIGSLGMKPKRSLVGILCTHGHPDHIGGASRLRRATGAPVMIHSGDKDLLERPSTFIRERLKLSPAGRLAMKFDQSPLKANFVGQKPDRILSHGDEVKVGQVTLSVIHTGGHSAGHCVFFDSERKLLFSGDELNNFPNEPRKFYVDLSGSLTTKLSAIERLSSMDIDYILPSHDVPHVLNDAKPQLDEVREAVVQFLDSVLGNLSARGEADVEQLAFDFEQSQVVPVPEGLSSLLVTTIEVGLHDLKKAGLAKVSPNGVWSPA
jgi:glyoxylase-like metal-dependent hydrolase (beta-lactamase superfamily II)